MNKKNIFENLKEIEVENINIKKKLIENDKIYKGINVAIATIELSNLSLKISPDENKVINTDLKWWRGSGQIGFMNLDNIFNIVSVHMISSVDEITKSDIQDIAKDLNFNENIGFLCSSSSSTIIGMCFQLFLYSTSQMTRDIIKIISDDRNRHLEVPHEFHLPINFSDKKLDQNTVGVFIYFSLLDHNLDSKCYFRINEISIH